MPKVHDVINNNKVVVISARFGYEEMFPGILNIFKQIIGDCRMWKVEAFKDIKKDFNEDVKIYKYNKYIR